MAVLPMKRLTVVAPRDRREALLQTLQDLGALHLVPLTEGGEASGEVSQRLMALKRQRSQLMSRSGAAAKRAKAGEGPPAEVFAKVRDASDSVVLQRVEAGLARRAELEGRLTALRKEAELARPWGKCVAADVLALREAGLNLKALRVRSKDLDPLRARVAEQDPPVLLRTLVLTTARKGEVGVLLASLGPLPEVQAESVEPPRRSLHAIEEELAVAEADLKRVGHELDALLERESVLDAAMADLTDQLALAEAKAQAGGDDEVFAVMGWCPAPREPHVRKEVIAHGGAVLVADPTSDDAPPVELVNGPVVRFFEPLMKAFQLPHYREGDPTMFVAPFMGLFFGFCLGDAGYGLLLFVLATVLGRKFNVTKGEALKAVRLVQTLGLATLVVGLLVGNVFGVPLYQDPTKANFGLNPNWALFFLSRDPAKFFYASLLFGVVQLTLGMLIRLVRNLRHGLYQASLGTLGWLLVMPSLVPLAAPKLVGVDPELSVGMRGIGLWVCVAFILLFNSPSKKVIKRIGGGAWALYNITGLFGDVMSYARIFGLGLSSGIIAQVINLIAMTVKDSVPVVGWIGALLILLFGHTFNFGMAVIGSVVHPARLQFLEFFGKFFEGGGQPYSPLKRSKGG